MTGAANVAEPALARRCWILPADADAMQCDDVLVARAHEARHRGVNPSLAHPAIEADPDIGLLLPCNVVVREKVDGLITVLFMDTGTVLQLVDKPEVQALGKKVQTLLKRACASLRS